MGTLGFDKYADPLKMYLAKYRDSVRGEKPEKKPSRKETGGTGGQKGLTIGDAVAMNFADMSGMMMSDDSGLPHLAPGKSEV